MDGTNEQFLYLCYDLWFHVSEEHRDIDILTYYSGSGKQPGKALKWYQDVLNCLELLLMIIDG